MLITSNMRIYSASTSYNNDTKVLSLITDITLSSFEKNRVKVHEIKKT